MHIGKLTVVWLLASVEALVVELSSLRDAQIAMEGTWCGQSMVKVVGEDFLSF